MTSCAINVRYQFDPVARLRLQKLVITVEGFTYDLATAHAWHTLGLSAFQARKEIIE